MGLAKVGVQCSVSTFAVNQNLVLRINICGEYPAHRNSENANNNNKLPPLSVELVKRSTDCE
jgi:hypothetical protein